ncbi:hypothetical protein BS17DRAFT_786233 [Gyrodon lividus]|nr:hypothetical protein BS17DRAFT_786233 [Gyrodon lividus]
MRPSDISQGSAQPPPKYIILCFDGTSGQFDPTNTNVVKFFGLLRKDLPEQQVAYYQAGVGTYIAPGVVSPLWTPLAELLDEAVAWYLDAHVMGGYRYLMDNYRPGDKICLFGFSRGAYTARALAGMLHKVGLLPRDNIQQISFAYKAYKRTDKAGIKLAAGFKETFSQVVKVDFVGVWDTVQSTGVLINRVLPFTGSNTAIRVFRQALALDEHRSRFRPDLYHWSRLDDGPDDNQSTIAQRVTSLQEAAIQKLEAMKSTIMGVVNKIGKRKPPSEMNRTKGSYGTFTHDSAREQACETGDTALVSNGEIVPGAPRPVVEFVAKELSSFTDVLEVWFSGCHSDIGGGNVQDDVKVSLAQIALHWMVEQVIESQCGILFDSAKLVGIGFTAPPRVPDPPVPAVTEQMNASGHGPLPVASEPPRVDTTLAITEIDNPSVRELGDEPRSGPYPELSNALAPLFDELKINKLWWLLEITPFTYAWQDDNGVWHTKWSLNLGKGRFIPYKQPKFHHTVKARINYQPLKYKPRAVYDHDEVYV